MKTPNEDRPEIPEGFQLTTVTELTDSGDHYNMFLDGVGYESVIKEKLIQRGISTVSVGDQFLVKAGEGNEIVEWHKCE